MTDQTNKGLTLGQLAHAVNRVTGVPMTLHPWEYVDSSYPGRIQARRLFVATAIARGYTTQDVAEYMNHDVQIIQHVAMHAGKMSRRWRPELKRELELMEAAAV